MRRRSSMGFTSRAYTFTLSSNTSPTTLASGVSSCMRLRQRSSVLLPQPDGPMMAVTVGSGNRSDTSRTARCCPNSAVSRTVSRRRRVLADATIALPRDPAGRERNDEHEAHQDEGRCPRQPVPFIEWARRIDVDLQRQRLHWLCDREREVEIAQCGEEQRSRLAGDARDAHHGPGDDAAGCPPQPRPIGTPINGATPTPLAVPTSAFAPPPPAWPAGTGLFVKNAQSIDEAPFTTRSPRMTTRASTAIRDSTTTSAVIARLTS